MPLQKYGVSLLKLNTCDSTSIPNYHNILGEKNVSGEHIQFKISILFFLTLSVSARVFITSEALTHKQHHDPLGTCIISFNPHRNQNR